MHSDREKTSKVNTQGKLRLKKCSSSTEIAVNSNVDHVESQNNYDSKHLLNKEYNEDTLADFKSPKEKKTHKPILNKYKMETKAKKKIFNSKNKTCNKTKNTLNVKQPSIESSFFKPQTLKNEIKESVPCSLCLKPFKDDLTCINHMKNCAAKNKVSMKQLLDAKQLQDRQAEERKAMGLLAAPALLERKKTFRPKNFTTGDDPQLQLVLAMSESLYEAEKMAELEQAALLAGFPSECIKDLNEEDRRATLQNFGFTTSKPISDIPIIKSKKKKLLCPTILQSRSKEDKDRVLSERIACIITGEDAYTQVVCESLQQSSPATIRSQNLRKILKLDDKLWDKTWLTKKYNQFYVQELKSHFLQSNQQPSESHEFKLGADLNNIEENILSNTSVEYDTVDFDVMDKENIESNSILMDTVNESENMNVEYNIINNMISNWGSFVNHRSESDIIIFVKHNQFIYAHKLVFTVQCQSILLHIKPNNVQCYGIKNKLSWLDTNKLAALAFLEFIYSGRINKNIDALDHDNLISEIYSLAKLYNVKQLFTYLKTKQNELNKKKPKTKKSDKNNKNYKSHDQCLITRYQSIGINPDFLLEKIKKTIYRHDISKNLLLKNSIDRRMTPSPDLFESENDETIYLHKTQKNKDSSISDKNLNISIDSIEEDTINILTQDTKNYHTEKKSDETKSINSQQTIINLSRTPSPHNNESSVIVPQNNINEALTPKLITPKKFDFDNKINDEIKTSKFNKLERNLDNIVKTLNKNYSEQQILESEISKCKMTKEITESNLLSKSSIHSTSNKSASKIMEVDVTVDEEFNKNLENSIHTAITPPKTIISKQIDNTFEKKLNLFLKKVQKENARRDSDSDSGSDLDMSEWRIKNINPFSKKNEDEDYNYLRHEGENMQIDVNRRKRILSLLEDEILEEEKKIMKGKERDNLSIKQNNVSTTFDKDEDVKESELSRYSKYKKMNKHNNSIEKYRNKIKFNYEESDNYKSCKKNDSDDSLNNEKLSSKNIFEDVTLVSDSEDEPNNSKSLINQKSNSNIKSHEENLVLKLPSNIISYIGNDNTGSLNLINDKLDTSYLSTKIDSNVLKKKSEDEIIDLSFDSDEEKKNDGTFPYISTIETKFSKDNESNQKIFVEKNFEQEKSLEISTKKNNDVDIEISKILQSSPEFVDNDNLFEKLVKDKLNNVEDNKINKKLNNVTQCEINLSPISITSSPENSDLNRSKSNQKNSCETKSNINTRKKKYQKSDFSNEEIACKSDSFENLFDKIEFNDSWIINSPLKELNSPPKNSEISSFASSPVLSLNKESSRKININSQVSPKLKTKSIFITNTPKENEEYIDYNVQSTSSGITSEQNEKLSKESTKRRRDVTPPPDYNKFSTFELQEELKKFGIKPLSSRKAVRLLNHIYKETHPSQSQKRTSSETSSNEDDKPPSKKPYIESSLKKNISNEKINIKKSKKLQKCLMTADEIEHDKPDVNISGNSD